MKSVFGLQWTFTCTAAYLNIFIYIFIPHSQHENVLIEIKDLTVCVLSSSLGRKKSSGLESAATIRTKVFVWGLNDKDQLGGLKGSKVRLTVYLRP